MQKPTPNADKKLNFMLLISAILMALNFFEVMQVDWYFLTGVLIIIFTIPITDVPNLENKLDEAHKDIVSLTQELEKLKESVNE